MFTCSKRLGETRCTIIGFNANWYAVESRCIGNFNQSAVRTCSYLDFVMLNILIPTVVKFINKTKNTSLLQSLNVIRNGGSGSGQLCRGGGVAKQDRLSIVSGSILLGKMGCLGGIFTLGGGVRYFLHCTVTQRIISFCIVLREDKIVCVVFVISIFGQVG